MKSVLSKLQYAGIDSTMSRRLIRSIILTNCISLLIVGLCGVLLIYVGIRAGWVRSSNILTVSGLVVLAIPFLNLLKYHNFSRFKISLIIPLISYFIIFSRRVMDPDAFEYLRSPAGYCILLAGMLVPLMVFSITERWLLITALLLNICFLMALDPLIYYYSKANGVTPYTFSLYVSHNFLVLLAVVLLVTCIQFLKTLFEQSDERNEKLIKKLNAYTATLKAANEELARVYGEIEDQNDELKTQQSELVDSQQRLLAAHAEIEEQKGQLEKKNQQLTQSLDEKSLDLLMTNQHLLQQNEELQQFSYTVSHNLRGPVASILGLLNLYAYSKPPDEKAQIIDLLGASAKSLESTILDLSKIIDIRNDKFSLIESVDLHDVVKSITDSLRTSIKENHVVLKLDLQVTELNTIKAYIHSILYNLISNAIQYRDKHRGLVISITNHVEGKFVVFEITDNGMGIDMPRYGHLMFRLYKRFHTHVQGKGLGLYLVKQQIEKLNGNIAVKSAPGEGTMFTFFHPVNPDLEQPAG